MRVGLVIYDDLSAISGGYLYDRKLVEHLQANGDSVEVISLPNPGYARALAGYGILNAINCADIDILVQDELVHPSMLLPNRRLRARRNIPIIGLVHLLKASTPVNPLRRSVFRTIEKNYLAGLDGIIFNSQHTLHSARILVGDKLPRHIVALPAGDNFETPVVPANPDSSAGVLRILYVGSVISQKGLDVLLRAVARLPPSSWEITVTGRLDMEPDYVRTIERQIARNGLGNNVRLTGPFTGRELLRVYRSHDLLVLPSVNEAYGIVYLEAQMFSLPVIGTTAGGASEIITDGHNGYLIEPDDDVRLAMHLRSLQEDRGLLTRLGRNAREYFLGHPVWADTGRQIRNFLVTTLEHHQSRP